MTDFYKVVRTLALMLLLFAQGYALRAQCVISNLQPAYCTDDAPIVLTGGANIYSDNPGLSGTTFSPAVAGPGIHTIYSATYTVSTSGSFSPLATTGAALTFGGDENSAPTPIGFNFTFFGHAYSSLVVNANGYVTFGSDPGSAASQALPDATAPNNLIAAVWDDLDISVPGGTISTELVGASPNRRFLITFDNVGYASGVERVTFQIQLYETTNLIEIHSTSVQDNGGAGMTQGIENAAGSGGYAVAGRNNTAWTAASDYVSFSPTCANVQNVTVSAAPSNSLAVISPANICQGTGAAVTIQSSEAGVLYQLQDATTSAPLSAFNAGTGSDLTIVSNNLFALTNIKVYAKNSTSGCDTELTATVGVDPSQQAPAIVTDPVDVAVCQGVSTTFTVDAGTTTSPVYRWQVSTDGGISFTNLTNTGPYSGVTTATLNIANAPLALNGRLYQVRVSGTCGSPAFSEAATLTVDANVSIGTQPAATAVCAGGTAQFSVAATGTALTYQWQESTDGGGTFNNVSNGGVYSGALTNNLTLTGTTAGYNNNQYRVVVGGSCAGPVTSGAGVLTVNTPAVIGTQPVSSAVCENGTVQFTVAATGTGVTYQWYEGPVTALSDAGVYSGTGTNQLTLTGVPSSFNARTYYVKVSGTCAAPFNSSVATLTVDEQPEITLPPANQAICSGGNATFSVSAGVTSSPTYVWEVSTNGGSSFSTVTNGGVYSGATTNTLTLTSPSATFDAYQYRVVVGGMCTPTVTSAAAVLTVNSPVVIGTQPVSAAVCENGTVQFTASASGTGLTYQWYEGPVTSLSDAGVYSGTGTNQLTLTNVPSTFNGRTYYVRVSGTCSTPFNSNVANLTVNERPEITLQPVNRTICPGGNTTFVVNAGVTTAATYQWQVSTNGGATFSNLSNGGVYSGVLTRFLNLTAAPVTFNSYQYRVIIGGTCTPTVTSSPAVLTVNSAVVIGTQPVSAAVCENGTVQFTVAATGTGVTYQWYEGPVTALTNAGVYSGTTTNQLTLTNVTSPFNGRNYYVRVSGTCTSAFNSSAATLTINEKPEITQQPVNQTICSGGNTTFTVNSGVTTSATYQWQVSTNGGATWGNVTNGGVYSGALTSALNLTAPPSAFNTYRYRVIVGGTCTPTVTSSAAILTVNAPAVIGTQPVSAVACENGTVQYTVAATGTGLTYQWYEGAVTVLTNTGVYSGTNTNQLTLTNVTSAFNGRTYYVKVGGTCSSAFDSNVATLTVNEKPEITLQPVDQTICLGGNTSFTVNAGVTTAATYQWEVSTDGGATFSNVANGGIYSGATTSTLVLTSATSTLNNDQYRVVVGGTCTPNVTSSAAVLTVNDPVVIGTQPVPAVVCEDGTVQFTASATGTGLVYQWYEGPVTALGDGGVYSGTGTNQLTLTNVPSSFNGRTYYVKVSGACTSGTNSSVATLTVNEKPEITLQPVNQTICSGGNTTFTINAGVTTAATYQWEVSTDGGATFNNVTNGGVYSGALTSALTLTAAPVIFDTYQYRVVVSGTCTPNVTSSPAVLTVNTPVVIGTQPVPAVICENGTVQFTASATGTGLTYQWYEGPVTALSDAGVYSGTTTNQLTLTNVPSTFNGRTYYVRVTGTCSALNSSVATLTVNEKPEITLQPVNRVICSAGNTTFTVNAGVTTAATYRWQVSTNGGATFTNLSNGGVYSGALSSTLNITGASAAFNNYQYRVVVSGTCTPGVTSTAAVLTVNSPVVIGIQPVSTTICENGGTQFTVAATGTGLAYQWQVSTNGGVSFASLANGGVYAGVTSNQLNLTSVPLSFNNYLYRVSLTGTCAPVVVSNSANLSVYQNPVINTAPVAQSICEGSGTTFSVAAVGQGLTYQWQENGSNISNGGVYAGATTATLNLSNVPFSLNGNTYSVVITGSCGIISSTPVALTVRRVPDAFAADASICSGQTTNIAITNPNAVATTSFTWTIQSSSNVSGASAGGGNTIAQALTTTDGVTNGSVTYLIQPTAAGCNGTPYAVNVLVAPVPDAAASPQTICSGNVSNVAITNPNGVAGTTFTWTVLSSSNVSGAAAGSGSVIAQMLTSTNGTSSGTVTYRITPSAGTCAGTPVNVTVTVTPTPVITNSPSTLLQEICSNTTLNFIPSASISGTTFTWTSTVIGTLTGVSVSGVGPINDIPDNATNTSAVIIYTITPHVASCAGTPANFVVTVRPVPTASASPQTICSGSASSVAITNPNSVSGTTYTWTAAATNVSGSSAGAGGVIAQVLSSADGVNNGSVTYTITPWANGCPGPTFPVTITVKPVPVLTNPSTTLAQTTCSGEALSFIPTASISGSTFSWTTTATGPIDPTSITPSGASNITQAPRNTGNVMGTVTYHIVPAFNGCAGSAIDFVVNVKPLPSVTASPVTICSGQTAVINLLPTPKNITGTTYAWTVSSTPNVIGATAADGSTISQQLTSTNASIGSVTYTITPMANGCYGTPINVTVTVNPIAVVNAGADYAVCQPTTIPITGTISGSATSGTWTIVSGGGTISGSTTSAGNVVATYTVNPADVGGNVVFRLSTNDPDGAGPCSIVTDNLSVAVNRSATVTLPADYVVCEPSIINLSGVLGGSATSGLWSLVTGTGTLSATSVTGTTATSSYQPSLTDISTVLRFRLTSNDPDGSGPCSSAFDEINITVNQAARIDAGPDFAVCEDQSITLAAVSGGATSTVLWSGGSGAAQFAPINDVNSIYTLTSADITAGGVTLKITTNDPDALGPCTSTADQVFVRINKLPAVFLAGLDAVYAENSGVDNLDGFPAGGTFTGAGIVAGTNQFNPANAGFGSITIRYTFTDPVTTCTNFTERTTVVNPVTDVDFFILEDNRPNPAGSPQICANQGDLTLVGIPPASEGLDPTKFRALSPELVPRIFQIGGTGGDWKLNTNGLLAGSYLLQYIFTNEYLATDTLTKELIVFSAPEAVIAVGNNCIEDILTFEESSSIPNNLSGGTIVNWNWLYGEGSNGSNGPTAEPQYQYIAPGPKTLSLEVMTNQGCRNKITKSIVVGQPPKPDFTWTAYCKGDSTRFVDRSTSQFGVVNGYAWEFGDGNTSSVKNPVHTYGTFGYYPVKLSITTDAGCAADTVKQVYIQELRALTDDVPYHINFENGPETWVAVTAPGDTTNSWTFGKPDADYINTVPSGTNAFWTGANAKSYYNDENSFVIGPCLNLTALKRPMISLKYLGDVQKGFDGAVVQYSTNGGNSWQTIGDAEGGGISWYNSRNLPGQPGGQSNFAWSEEIDTTKAVEWKNARFNLDQIPINSRDTVILRIAFGSNADNPSGRRLNGFAFDDVFVGAKTRNVLIEHFANISSGASNNVTGNLNDLYVQQLTAKDSSDFNFIEYHIPGTGPDQFNVDNPQDPLARALFYNVSTPPNTVVDGLQTAVFDGSGMNINAVELDRQALLDPRFAIAIDTATAPGATNTSIRVKVGFTYIDTTTTLSTRTMMNVALVERGVNTNGPIVRKLLLGPQGKTYERSWVAGDVESIDIEYEIDVPIINPDSVFLVAFAQDNVISPSTSKAILQSRVTKMGHKKKANILGVEDNPLAAELADLSLYPNPASNILKVTVPGTLGRRYVWRMIDQRGVTVLGGDLKQDFTTGPQEIDVSGLANGIYFMSIQTGSQSVVYRKVAIMNRN